MARNHEAQIEALEDGRFRVSCTIPGWGEQLGKVSDQVRRLVQGEAEAEQERKRLQALRDEAVARRQGIGRDRHPTDTSLSPDEQASAEDAARLIREKGEKRSILELVEAGLKTRSAQLKPLSTIVDEFLAEKKPRLSQREYESRFAEALLNWLQQFDEGDGQFAYDLIRQRLVFLSFAEIQHFDRRRRTRARV